ncbi:MAG: HEAT repeat domain-containing protein [Myxococcota bacterium]
MAVDKREALRRAKAALDAHRSDEALVGLWALVDRPHLSADEFERTLRLMARAYAMNGLGRPVSAIHLYLGDHDTALRTSDDPRDKARVRVAAGQLREAAKLYNEAGLLGHAAIQLEDAGDLRGARVLWERLSQDVRLQSEPYTLGLVRFNLGRCCEAQGDDAEARRATIAAIHLLEAAADGFEAVGLRERAFDCFQILLVLGRDGAFENLAEGYRGCIRILSEDNLKYYVLQYFEDFQKLALERDVAAAAALFREAAAFCRRHQLPYETHYRLQAAETQVRAARLLEQQATPEMAENAYASAIDLFNDLGAYSRIRDVYEALSKLKLGDARVARYRRLQQRLAAEQDEPINTVAFPDYLRMDTAYPEIWRLDVIEWEQQGDAAETMSEVILDAKWPDFTRRRALLCQLHQLGKADALDLEGLKTLARRLGRVEIYAALGPLEFMIDHADAGVRAAVVEAARQLFFKRTFGLIMRGLDDEIAAVQRQALEAVRQLHFGHAFDPLQRIYHRSQDAAVRSAALESIGRIPSLESVEMLIDALRQGTPDERGQILGLLVRADHSEADALLRRAHEVETGPTKEALAQVITSRRR